MATSVQWAKPLDERTTSHAVDYATRSARFALRRGEASIAIRIARQLAMAQPGVEAHRQLLTEALAARDAASDFIARNGDADDAETVDRLAVSHLALGDYSRASQLWLQLARADQTRVDAFLSFGWCMARVGNFDLALQIADRVSAVVQHPKVEALRMMVALASGDQDAALAHGLSAKAMPDAFMWVPHGATFEATGIVNAASLSLAQRLDDISSVMHLYDVAQALQSGRPDEAIRMADLVLGAIPDDRWAALFKIMALVSKEDKMGAVQAQADLAAVTGVRLDVLTRLVDLLFEIGAHKEVLELGAIVRERLPKHLALISTIAHAAAHMGDMDLAEEMGAALEPLAETILRSGLSPFIVMTLTDDPALHRLAAEQRARILPGPDAPSEVPLAAPPRGERIRIGYFSNDFHNHATMKLLIEALEATDRSRFEVFAYSYDGAPNDAERERVRKAVEHFKPVVAMTEGEVADLARADGIHVMVDLKGYTGGSRLGLLKYRPAPIQVNWLGYPGTYGMAEADYILADPFIIPPGSEAHYSEAVVRLPDCYQPNRRSREVVETPSRAMVGLPETGFVFASFNHVYKVNGPVFGAWMDILKAVPGSVLWLLAKDPAVSKALGERAEAHGVAADRLIFGPVIDNDRHLARYGLVDLALDTFPVGSHTTASDAIWMGAPLLAMAGGSFISRVSGSIVTAAGQPQLVAGTLEEYVAKAVAIGNDPGMAQGLREDLLRRRETMPLFDPARFAEHLGRAYETMVAIWQEGGRPRGFDVPSVDAVPARSVEVA